MKICDELRQAVLQAAIQGKLTRQRKEDGDARDLLKQIAEEKAQLIKEKKIKKEKPLPEIAEDEVPFDIPENWVWVRLPEIATSGLGKTLNATKDTGVVKEYLCSINIYWEGISLAKVKTAPFSEGDIEKYRLEKGDLLICEGGDVGRSAIWDEAKEMYYQNALHRVRFYGNINQYYFLFILKFYKHLGLLNEVSKGETIKHLVQGSLYSLVFPIPPLAEQQRIVAKVEKLMVEIDELEKVENELIALKKTFPGDMKAALLQAAMQGELTTQRKEDGNAKELLKQITEEKAKLVKEGKLKKEKPLVEISEDEIPFDIPENWVWVRLGAIGAWGSGATPSKSEPKYYGGNIRWLLTGDLNDGYIDEVEGRITKLALEKTSVKMNPVGSVLIAMYGATIGKLGINNVPVTTNQACCGCKPLDGVYNKYLFYFLMSHKSVFTEKAEGGAQPNISKEKIVATLMPLPPFAEQERIVAKLDKLLPLCDSLL